MTDRPQRSLDEIRVELRKFQRAMRDEKLRQGKARPRTHRETEIFGEYLRELTERGRVTAEDAEDGPSDDR